jgi:tetratricopeptide (TPR) repeat protein
MSESSDNFKRSLAVAIAVVSVLAASIAYLQADAAARDDRANRDSKRYATEAFGRRVAGDARTNFDYYSAYQAWYEFDTLAASAEKRGDARATRRYETMRERMTRITPLLAPPYFDPEKGDADVARWEADQYVEEIAALGERFVAASAVKEAWDAKANTYIVHLTLLAVALALLGLATTLPGSRTGGIFAGTAALIAGVAVLWAAATFFRSVPDLRTKKGAIEAYAKGAGLVHRERWEEAVKAFDAALAIVPDYANALAARADAQSNLGQHEKAAADYEKARAAGESRAAVAGMLAWTYYEQGRFDDAVAMNRTALAADPGELWIQYDLALAQLAAGKLEDARASYRAALDAAAKTVADAKTAGKEAPSVVWESMDDAGQSLDALLDVLEGDGKTPPKAKIAQAEAVKAEIHKVIPSVKEMAVSLEYAGVPPQGQLSASIGPLHFAAVSATGAISHGHQESFPASTANVALRVDYKGMKKGQSVVVKAYLAGEEDPSWRYVGTWDQGASGRLERVLAPPTGGAFTVLPGEYLVEVYVDAHLAGRGEFEVLEEGAAAPAEEAEGAAEEAEE